MHLLSKLSFFQPKPLAIYLGYEVIKEECAKNGPGLCSLPIPAVFLSWLFS
jgi:hypothetical protein